MREGIFGALYGIALAICGHSFTTWQFYVLIVLAVIWRNWPRADRLTGATP